jgi:hypothetical protein
VDTGTRVGHEHFAGVSTGPFSGPAIERRYLVRPAARGDLAGSATRQPVVDERFTGRRQRLESSASGADTQRVRLLVAAGRLARCITEVLGPSGAYQNLGVIREHDLPCSAEPKLGILFTYCLGRCFRTQEHRLTPRFHCSPSTDHHDACVVDSPTLSRLREQAHWAGAIADQQVARRPRHAGAPAYSRVSGRVRSRPTSPIHGAPRPIAS